MANVLSKKHNSKDFAKDRLKTVLISERLDCTPETLLMMRNDIIQSIGKYLPIDEKNVKITYTPGPNALEAHIPLHKTEESERTYAETI